MIFWILAEKSISLRSRNVIKLSKNSHQSSFPRRRESHKGNDEFQKDSRLRGSDVHGTIFYLHLIALREGRDLSINYLLFMHISNLESKL